MNILLFLLLLTMAAAVGAHLAAITTKIKSPCQPSYFQIVWRGHDGTIHIGEAFRSPWWSVRDECRRLNAEYPDLLHWYKSTEDPE